MLVLRSKVAGAFLKATIRVTEALEELKADGLLKGYELIPETESTWIVALQGKDPLEGTKVLDDLEISRCWACECSYGSLDCYGCPLYEGEIKDEQV